MYFVPSPYKEPRAILYPALNPEPKLHFLLSYFSSKIVLFSQFNRPDLSFVIGISGLQQTCDLSASVIKGPTPGIIAQDHYSVVLLSKLIAHIIRYIGTFSRLKMKEIFVIPN